MRLRVAAMVSGLAVLIVAAIVASYFLERVETTTTSAPQPLITPVAPTPSRIEIPKPVVNVPDAAVVISQPAPPRDFPPADPINVPFYVGPGSSALQAVCQSAVERCAQTFPPWFASTISTELELERSGTGSRIARAHPGATQRNGPPAFNQCVVDALKGSELPEVPLENDQHMVRCVPRTSKTKTLFPSGAKFRDELKRCLSKVPEGEVTVKFSVTNDHRMLKSSALTFTGLDEIDGYARRCLELGLETKVAASPGDIPEALPTVTLSVSDEGRKVSNSYSFGAR